MEAAEALARAADTGPEAAWRDEAAARILLSQDIRRSGEGGGRAGVPVSTARKLCERLLRRQPDEAVAGRLARLLWDDLDTRWTVLRPIRVASEGGATLSVLPDGSVLASGTNPPDDAYTVEAETDLSGITALRLEALPHPSLPAGGPGRCPGRPQSFTGAFALHEITLTAADARSPDRPTAVRLVGATASFSGPFCEGHFGGVRGAIDDRADSFWEVSPRVGESHHAVFGLAGPVGPGRTRLTVRLEFPHGFPHALGHFRLAVRAGASPSQAEPFEAFGPNRLPGRGWTSLAAARAARGEWRQVREAIRSAPFPGARPAEDDLLLALACAHLGETEDGMRALRRALAPGGADGVDRPSLTRAVLDGWLALRPDDAAVIRLRDEWQRRAAPPK
jgi:hypothetical protein